MRAISSSRRVCDRAISAGRASSSASSSPPLNAHTGRTSTIAIPETLTTATDSFRSPGGQDPLIHKGFRGQRTDREGLVPLSAALSGRTLESGQVVHSNRRNDVPANPHNRPALPYRCRTGPEQIRPYIPLLGRVGRLRLGVVP